MEEGKAKTDVINWYTQNRPLYDLLAKKVESILHEIIRDQKIPIHAISSRPKDVDSFAKKIEDPKYTDPISQITDLSGIRVITYVESDLDTISKLVEDIFFIDKENSIDKSNALGTDKVGYISIHYIAKLSDDRIKFPENKKFENLYFEIQLRTILQHAWAEIEHDRNYKFTGELPPLLKRRFKVLAGVLELVDREFNQIAHEIDKHIERVNTDMKKGNLDIPIDSTSIKSFLKIKFEAFKRDGFDWDFFSKEHEIMVLKELRDFGITSLKELDEIIPNDYMRKLEKFYRPDSGSDNFGGILRDLMLIKDHQKYFKKCWKKSWLIIDNSSINLLETYIPNIRKILQEHEIDIY